MSDRPRLHVIGCSPAWPNPGEPASCYLVEAGATRLLLDCGWGSLASLLARDPAPVEAVVLSHLHFDHVADLIPLGFALRFDRLDGWGDVRLLVPPGGLEQLARLTEAAGHGADHLDVFAGEEYDPAGGVDVGSVRLRFGTMEHPGTSRGIRLEAGGASLCYSGDTSPTPALASLAAGAELLLCEASMGVTRAKDPVHLRGSEAAQAAREAGVGRLVLTHVEDRDREATLAAARAVYDGPVELARPGLQVQA